MENNLLKKLNFKPGAKVIGINAPGDVAAVFGNTSGVTLVDKYDADYTGLLIFITNSLELKEALSAWSGKIGDNKTVWFAYPKKSSGIPTDLKMEKWKELEEFNLTPCASAAINDTWTGIRIKPIDQVKKSGVGNQEIKNNEYAEFIDVENKKVTAPPNLSRLLLQHPQAADFFKSLAYSHQKEYVLWILTAKQEATRTARLQKTIEMLLTGKRNPTAR